MKGKSNLFLTPEQVRTVLDGPGAEAGWKPAIQQAGSLRYKEETEETKARRERGIPVPGWYVRPWEDKAALLARVSAQDATLRDVLREIGPLKFPVEKVRVNECLSFVDATVLLGQWLWCHSQYLDEDGRNLIRKLIVEMEDRLDVYAQYPVNKGGERC